mgnify:FL=1
MSNAISAEKSKLPDIAAVAAHLRDAQLAWQGRGLDGRREALMAFADALADPATGMIDALYADTGRRRISVMEVEATAKSIARWCRLSPAILDSALGAGASKTIPSVRFETRLHPYPLVGAIGPWNFPLLLALIDAIPAWLAGSAVLIKPSEVTTSMVSPLRRALAQVPALDAVSSVAEGGAEMGSAVLSAVDAVCFTGSVATGRKIAVAAAERMIPAFLELGGKDPAIVLGDAELDRAVTAIVRGGLSNAGQACQSIERVYVDRRIFSAFVEKLAAAVRFLRLTRDDPGGAIGPIIAPAQVSVIGEQLREAVARGARIVVGGEIDPPWIAPTVVCDVDHDMRLMREETFGPVLPVMPFETVEQALALANDSAYGLSGAVFSVDLSTAQAVAERLRVGAVSINDASLTALINEAEKNSFGLSGLGASRMGPSGLLRFFRKQVHFSNDGQPIPIGAFQEMSEAV